MSVGLVPRGLGRLPNAALASLLVALLASLASPASQPNQEASSPTPGDPGIVAGIGYVGSAPTSQVQPYVSSADTHGDLTGLAVDFWSGWPKAIGVGYFPIFVRLENTTGAAALVSIEVERSGGNFGDNYRTNRSVRLAPGEVRVVELLAAAFDLSPEGSAFGLGAFVTVRSVNGETFYASFDPEFSPTPVWPMIATRDASSGALVEAPRLAQALRAKDFDVQLAAVPSDRLPRRIEAYTSLAAVLVDTRALPSESSLEPALAWARLGGAIVFLGPDAEAAARSLSSVQPWMEPRFERFRRVGDGAWRMGHGRVVVVDSDYSASSPAPALVRAALAEAPAHLAPSVGSLRARPSIPGLGELPYRAFAVLMVLFAVLVGPVNFVALRRANRSALLLVTIPLLAGAVSLVFLLYGVLHQGLDVKRAEFSLTLLDQRSHRASTLSARQVFAGLVPGGGMHPEPGTVVLPRPHEEPRHGLHALRLDDAELSMAGDYLPARDAVDQVVLTDRTSRLRMVLDREGDALFAENALTERVLRFAYRAPEGGWYGCEGAIEPGQRAELSSNGPREPKGDLVLRAESLDLWSGKIPAGAFVAQVETNPFLDDCGLGSVEYEGWHLVVGIPEEAP